MPRRVTRASWSVPLLALAALAFACGPPTIRSTVLGRSNTEQRVAEVAAEEFGCSHEVIVVEQMPDSRNYVAEGCRQRAVYSLSCSLVRSPRWSTWSCQPELESIEDLPERLGPDGFGPGGFGSGPGPDER